MKRLIASMALVHLFYACTTGVVDMGNYESETDDVIVIDTSEDDDGPDGNDDSETTTEGTDDSDDVVIQDTDTSSELGTVGGEDTETESSTEPQDTDTSTELGDTGTDTEQTSVDCEGSQAVDMGTAGTYTIVPTNSCMIITEYPTYFASGSVLALFSAGDGAGYPVPFVWENQCHGSGGNGTIVSDWQNNIILGEAAPDCATYIKLEGTTVGTITLYFYQN